MLTAATNRRMKKKKKRGRYSHQDFASMSRNCWIRSRVDNLQPLQTPHISLLSVAVSSDQICREGIQVQQGLYSSVCVVLSAENLWPGSFESLLFLTPSLHSLVLWIQDMILEVNELFWKRENWKNIVLTARLILQRKPVCKFDKNVNLFWVETVNVGGCKQNSGWWSLDRASQCRFQNNFRTVTITSKTAKTCVGNVLLTFVFFELENRNRL